MKAGNFKSWRAFARSLGISHVQVSQVLGLLKLCPDARKDLDDLGDHLYSRKVTERKLRLFVNMPNLEQNRRHRKILDG